MEMAKHAGTKWLGLVAASCIGLACTTPAEDTTPSGPGGQGTQPGGSGSSAAPSGGGGSGSTTGVPGTIGPGGGNAGMGALTDPGEGGTGAAGQPVAGNAGSAGAGVSGSAAPSTLAPSKRNPAYVSVAPPLGQALPTATPGTWTYLDVDGALSRDGSPAGFYYKYSTTGDKNLLIYLAGGGLCADNFFCNMNPPNKTASLTAESVGSGVFNIFGPDIEAQDPTLERWNSGIFKDDPANPVKDWNMIFIPYVTGDLFGGAKPNGTVPDVEGTFQFVGHFNMMKFVARIVPTFAEAQTVLLTGSSAGGIGALLTAPYLMDAYIDLGVGTRMFALDDAGPIFDDAYLEPCFQERFRGTFALNDSFPSDCTACKGTGGGMVKTYLAYLVDKYPDNLLGGLIDSDADEIMSFFFSEALEDCSYIDNPLTGLLVYPPDRYAAGLKDLRDVHMKRMSTYIWAGALHQNLFMTASGDRFYETNGLRKSPAQWLTGLLSGTEEHLGLGK